MTNYLASGEQTQITPLVQSHAERARDWDFRGTEFASLPEPILSVYKTCKYIGTLPRISGYGVSREEDKRIKRAVFRSRTIDQVLQEGFLPTCSDIGLLFPLVGAVTVMATFAYDSCWDDEDSLPLPPHATKNKQTAESMII